jgi:hypothetical protein
VTTKTRRVVYAITAVAELFPYQNVTEARRVGRSGSASFNKRADGYCSAAVCVGRPGRASLNWVRRWLLKRAVGVLGDPAVHLLMDAQVAPEVGWEARQCLFYWGRRCILKRAAGY